MKRLKLFILLFCACLSVPMGYLVWHTYRSMEQEEISELRYFAATLFERMEEELAAMIQEEEARAVDEYTHASPGPGNAPKADLSRPSEKSWLLGYLQSNPDGSFQSPLLPDISDVPPELAGLTARLSEVNRLLNDKRSKVSEKLPFKPAEMKAAVTREKAEPPGQAEAEATPPGIAQKYFDFSRQKKQKSYLGRKESRVEEVSVRQALNIDPAAKAPLPGKKKTGGYPAKKRAKRSAEGALGEKLNTALAGAPSMETEGKNVFASSSSASRSRGRGAKYERPTKEDRSLPPAPATPLPVGSGEADRDDSTSNRSGRSAGVGRTRILEDPGDETGAGAPGKRSAAKRVLTAKGAPGIGTASAPEKVTGAASAMGAGSAVDGFSTRTVEIRALGETALAADGVPDEESEPLLEDGTFRVEVDPMQSLVIDDGRILIFRRIVIDNRVFRQGFVLLTEPFLKHMAETHFAGQPLARFTGLSLKVLDREREIGTIKSGTPAKRPIFSLERTFPRPFSFIRATLTCDRIPRSASRKTLNLVMGASILILLLGLYAVYRSARTLVELSERRASFVSSVTHELKTPLTNIRMYIEMLEQGIARSREREQDYFRILGSESARLSRLIDNVLEFSRLEKKKRYMNPTEGTLEEVVVEVAAVMREKLRQEGFSLEVRMDNDAIFSYDREMMIQVLINLVENSMKFGKTAKNREITIGVRRRGKEMEISVTDKGPGIPESALKRIFDDFFRAESELVRNTRGTGIGLALVKRFVTAMGGRVNAANNRGAAGCTITVFLPISPGVFDKRSR